MYNDSLTDSVLDIRDLAEMADNALVTVIEFEEGEADQDDADEALELLGHLKAFLAELGHSGTANAKVGDELRSVGDNSGVTLIREDYVEDYAKEYLIDCGMIPADLPAILASNINWAGIADDFKDEWSSADLDGTTYYLS